MSLQIKGNYHKNLLANKRNRRLCIENNKKQSYNPLEDSLFQALGSSGRANKRGRAREQTRKALVFPHFFSRSPSFARSSPTTESLRLVGRRDSAHFLLVCFLITPRLSCAFSHVSFEIPVFFICSRYIEFPLCFPRGS